jgi:hypothetical protein
MEYNFSSITVEALAKLEKQLQKIKVALMDDVSNFVHILNNDKINNTHGEMCTTISDLFNDEIKKSVLGFTGCLNKVQATLNQYL